MLDTPRQVQAFSERIESVQSQVNAMEEKVLNCGRLIKLMQQYNEEVLTSHDAVIGFASFICKPMK